MKISVLCFDVSDNAAGRADLLARLLEPLGPVEVIGPRTGQGVWEPVASGPVRYDSVESRRMPGFLRTMTELARRADGDLVLASKTKLGSAGVGYLKRVRDRRPLLLDIDDWEVGFHLRSGLWGTLGRAVNLGNAAGLPWTWLCERFTGLADGITVASRFLQQRFGGSLITHVRDTDAWKPGCADPAEARRRLGLGRGGAPQRGVPVLARGAARGGLPRCPRPRRRRPARSTGLARTPLPMPRGCRWPRPGRWRAGRERAASR